MSIIFLTGMPAAGKTYWANKVAEYYGWHSVDLDELIELQEGRAIVDIFEDSGEDYFRDIESKILEEVVAQVDINLIVSTGGGTVMRQENRMLMSERGCVVYLEEPLELLQERIVKEEAKRPMFSGNVQVIDKLKSLLEAREGFYKEADHIFSHEKKSVVNFGEILKKCSDLH